MKLCDYCVFKPKAEDFPPRCIIKGGNRKEQEDHTSDNNHEREQTHEDDWEPPLPSLAQNARVSPENYILGWGRREGGKEKKLK